MLPELFSMMVVSIVVVTSIYVRSLFETLISGARNLQKIGAEINTVALTRHNTALIAIRLTVD